MKEKGVLLQKWRTYNKEVHKKNLSNPKKIRLNLDTSIISGNYLERPEVAYNEIHNVNSKQPNIKKNLFKIKFPETLIQSL